MKFDPDKMPCIDCICFAMCKGQDMNDLLNKCSLLKSYMEIDLDHFDNAYTIIGKDYIKTLTLPTCHDYTYVERSTGKRIK